MAAGFRLCEGVPRPKLAVREGREGRREGEEGKPRYDAGVQGLGAVLVDWGPWWMIGEVYAARRPHDWY